MHLNEGMRRDERVKNSAYSCGLRFVYSEEIYLFVCVCVCACDSVGVCLCIMIETEHCVSLVCCGQG